MFGTTNSPNFLLNIDRFFKKTFCNCRLKNYFQLGLLHARASAAAASADSLNQLHPHPSSSGQADSTELHPTIDPTDQLLAAIPINSARY